MTPAPVVIAALRVGPYDVDVVEHASPIGDDDEDGQLDTTVRPIAIRVATRCQGPERWAVIVHELTHLALWIGGAELDDKVEEAVCNLVGLTVTSALVTFLPTPPRVA